MKKRKLFLYLRTTIIILLFISGAFISCAKRGAITGGLKDTIPPVFVRAVPPNFSTNFKEDEVRIYFDEYIQLKDAQKQIIVSPPMSPKPTISPLGGASKYVKIEFLDTLLQNTTYSINFGQSVVDNNESNPYPFLRYVFSTGNELDSLKIEGRIFDALEKEIEPYVTIALYEVDENYKDSLIYKEVPRYITSTLDSITDFSLENLREGQYQLVILKDKSVNYTYEPQQDKIGFYSEIISLPKDTAKVFEVALFKEVLDYRPLRPKQRSRTSFIFPYEGKRDSLYIRLLSEKPEDFQSRIIPDKEKDSVYYFYKPYFETDSLIFEITNGIYRDTLVSPFREQYKDSLNLTPVNQGTLPFDKSFKVTAEIPLSSVNDEFIKVIDKDSVNVDFKTKLDELENEVTFSFDRIEENSYQLELLPGAIKDFYENTNDTTFYNIRIPKKSDYGTIFLTLEEVEQYPVIAQITMEGEVIAEKVVPSKETTIFNNIEPGKYDIRVILDRNNNGVWDTGSFLDKLQPEEVFYFPELIDLRGNWERKETFILK
ncbi:Ig-like domain-containing protein [Aquimarina sp. ERC-38]|uniref:Ig-like domain-containing protein n=1 Tax=Aquimarina sp. ERC-38 TaxID=2949996 RepID=UPI0022462A57|nr:Ig-like domain-containing protein [Aquimarina sp. ERC-38]UZO82145.1 Ig-like domain-containing protein [Aquimarina sp. ERC-38]